MYLRELVRDGNCEVNGVLENRGYVLRTNDFVEISVDRARQTSLQPEDLPLTVRFEDSELLIVDKPAGMLIHPTVRVRGGTLLNAVAHYLNADDPEIFRRAGLVHRLDKGTSGLVVIAKTAHAHRVLCRHFQRKMIEKRYLAIASGILNDDSGTIEAPIGRFAEQRIWAVKTDGKPAISNFEVLRRGNSNTLVSLEPVTGRTNQLRIHLAHVGHPILGDMRYGGPEYPRLCLHAAKISFAHPVTGVPISAVSPTPSEMEFLLD